MPTHATNRSNLKVKPTKVSSVEEAYGVKFNVPKNMNLGTYFERQGLSPLAKVLRITEKHLQSR